MPRSLAGKCGPARSGAPPLIVEQVRVRDESSQPARRHLSHRLRRPRRFRHRDSAAPLLRGALPCGARDGDAGDGDLLLHAVLLLAHLGPAQRSLRTQADPPREPRRNLALLCLDRLCRRPRRAPRGARARGHHGRQHLRRPGLYRGRDPAGAARPRHGTDRRRLRARLHRGPCARRRARRRRSAQSPCGGAGLELGGPLARSPRLRPRLPQGVARPRSPTRGRREAARGTLRASRRRLARAASSGSSWCCSSW